MTLTAKHEQKLHSHGHDDRDKHNRPYCLQDKWLHLFSLFGNNSAVGSQTGFGKKSQKHGMGETVE